MESRTRNLARPLWWTPRPPSSLVGDVAHDANNAGWRDCRFRAQQASRELAPERRSWRLHGCTVVRLSLPARGHFARTRSSDILRDRRWQKGFDDRTCVQDCGGFATPPRMQLRGAHAPAEGGWRRRASSSRGTRHASRVHESPFSSPQDMLFWHDGRDVRLYLSP